MHPVKLFSLLAAIMFLSFVFNRADSPFLVVLRYNLAPAIWEMIGAALSAGLAVAYFWITFLANRNPNQTAGLIGFLMIAIPLALWVLSTIPPFASQISRAPIALTLILATFVFALGSLVSVLNLAVAYFRT
jgi:hypothetical protein